MSVSAANLQMHPGNILGPAAGWGRSNRSAGLGLFQQILGDVGWEFCGKELLCASPVQSFTSTGQRRGNPRIYLGSRDCHKGLNPWNRVGLRLFQGPSDGVKALPRLPLPSQGAELGFHQQLWL